MNEYRNCFIELENEIDCKKEQPASYVKKYFVVKRPYIKAMIRMTSLGCYKGMLNGKPLGEQLLTPGYTDYHYRLQYQTYDVTHELIQEENLLEIMVGDGWFRGCIDIGSKRNSYGTKLKLLCVITIQYEDGEVEEIVTDEFWQACQDGPMRENNIKTIERYDATCTCKSWHNTRRSSYKGDLVPQEGELLLEHEVFHPKVLHTPNGNTVLDMGQNFAGHVKFSVKGNAGDRVALTMGEELDEAGNFTMKNLVAEGASIISGTVGQRLEYTLRQGSQTYQSIFLISGFRYVLLENWPEEVNGDNFQGIAVYTDISFVGDFTCSNPLVNKLVENIRWSEKSNFVDIPGDCPTRERSGWTADISIFSETACYLSNPRKFLKKWIHDYKLEQGEDGNLPYVVPSAGKGQRQRGSLGWANAICNISMVLYKFYGEKEDIEDVYECVKRFVDYNVKIAKKKNVFYFWKTGAHRRYIVETGFHYGEWLEPGRPMYKDYVKDLFYPDTEVTTAWFHETVSQFIEMGKLLHHSEDVEKYQRLEKELYAAYQKEFIHNDTIHSKRMCRYVRPIAHNLVNTQQRANIAEKLNSMCIANQYRLGTGFLTTYQLLKVLTECGYIDTAYRMLENTKQPGWLYAVTKGATTTWESWNGITEDGAPVDSHNHFAPGAIAAWLFAYAAGIQPVEPGFRKVKIQPFPGGSFRNVHCKYHSMQGDICVSWEVSSAKRFSLTVQAPSEVETQVIMPDGHSYLLEKGEGTFYCEL